MLYVLAFYGLYYCFCFFGKKLSVIIKLLDIYHPAVLKITNFCCKILQMEEL